MRTEEKHPVESQETESIDSNKKKKRRKKIRQYYDIEDLKEIITGDAQDLSVKHFAIAVAASEAIAVIATIFQLILQMNLPMMILTASMAFGVPLIFFATGAIFHDEYGRIARHYIAVGMILILASLWFFTGGEAGSATLWCIFSFIYVNLTFGGKEAIIYNLFDLVVQIGAISCLATRVFPVLKVSETKLGIDNVVSLALIILYVSVVIVAQKKTTEHERRRNLELQEELTASYEETQASNEELIASNDELTRLTESLKKASDTQRRFTASLNHELRAPLNAITGVLQIILADPYMTQETKTMISQALVNCESMTQIVNDLLDFAKIQEGKFEIIKKSFPIKQIFDQMDAMFTHQAEAKELKFQIKSKEAEDVMVYGDQTRIQQILTNLVSNAIKYTDKGAVNLRYEVDTAKKLLTFSVEDSGQGMSEEDVKYLFEPYKRFNLDKNVQVTGTGLGMNIVDGLIHQMQGEIEVKSTLGRGTRFVVRIPIDGSDDQNEVAQKKEQDASSLREKDTNSTDFLKKKKILCVDDTEMNLVVLKGLMHDTGAILSVSLRGEEALELMEKNTYDVILMDHMMPDLSGVEIFQKLKADEKYALNAATPVIMLTGNVTEEAVSVYKELGVDGYLGKPVRKDILLDMLKKLDQGEK